MHGADGAHAEGEYMQHVEWTLRGGHPVGR
jgi:hypothetical protein